MSLTKQQINELEQSLLSMKKQLEQQQELRENEESLQESTGEISSVDSHFGDMGSELYDREMAMALDENQEEILEDINEALQRIEEGTYGKCVDTGEEIPFERLKALPYAKRTVEAQEVADREGKTSGEYEIQEPSFVRQGEKNFEDSRMRTVDEIMDTHGNASNKGEDA
ncbi:transcriptional regulator, TraR/DksA family [Fictibacillus solisalsi]|uniref:Transcriptional regulator, TraR/DksA family n=1 Tax=Fictibacillus solisalsi TaxID=459525 RepID=A0A1H0B079_9BACL|nr:TraR/DksA C4-type zinc finger protein [Fictibacillus solisalsi]SDN39050.1 transcriptional regulator, TraR/DksA family [Fictibacillus solisalsi]